MGGDNFTKFKITEEVSKGNIKIIPDIIIGSNGSDGPMNGLMGMQLLQLIQEQKKKGEKNDN